MFTLLYTMDLQSAHSVHLKVEEISHFENSAAIILHLIVFPYAALLGLHICVYADVGVCSWFQFNDFAMRVLLEEQLTCYPATLGLLKIRDALIWPKCLKGVKPNLSSSHTNTHTHRAHMNGGHQLSLTLPHSINWSCLCVIWRGMHESKHHQV